MPLFVVLLLNNATVEEPTQVKFGLTYQVTEAMTFDTGGEHTLTDVNVTSSVLALFAQSHLIKNKSAKLIKSYLCMTRTVLNLNSVKLL
jgi:hypothetical protein